MYWRHLHILLFATTLRCGLARGLFHKFMPRLRSPYQDHHPNEIHSVYVPLYVLKGPDPASDYMANHFKPKNVFKRVRFPFHRFRRQVNNDEYIQDLYDSFGGMEKINSPETEETNSEDYETTKPNTKSGFYYLLDWNSFLEVDDQNGRRVNLRVQPKFGDPKRFFSVTVP